MHFDGGEALGQRHRAMEAGPYELEAVLGRDAGRILKDGRDIAIATGRIDFGIVRLCSNVHERFPGSDRAQCRAGLSKQVEHAGTKEVHIAAQGGQMKAGLKHVRHHGRGAASNTGQFVSCTHLG